MITYAFINKETSVLENMCSWGDNPMPSSYEIPENQIYIEIDENQRNTFKQSTLNGKTIKILDINTLEFEEFTEEVVKIPTEAEILQERINLLEQAMNEMLLGGV